MPRSYRLLGHPDVAIGRLGGCAEVTAAVELKRRSKKGKEMGRSEEEATSRDVDSQCPIPRIRKKNENNNMNVGEIETGLRGTD